MMVHTRICLWYGVVTATGDLPTTLLSSALARRWQIRRAENTVPLNLAIHDVEIRSRFSRL